jgi:hypothetical protein
MSKHPANTHMYGRNTRDEMLPENDRRHARAGWTAVGLQPDMGGTCYQTCAGNPNCSSCRSTCLGRRNEVTAMMEPYRWSWDAPAIYQIRVRGALDQRWVVWFDGLTISHNAASETTLTGPVVDQAGLYGLISRARDLGLTLLAVNRVMVDGLGDTPAARHTR